MATVEETHEKPCSKASTRTTSIAPTQKQHTFQKMNDTLGAEGRRLRVEQTSRQRPAGLAA